MIVRLAELALAGFLSTYLAAGYVYEVSDNPPTVACYATPTMADDLMVRSAAWVGGAVHKLRTEDGWEAKGADHSTGTYAVMDLWARTARAAADGKPLPEDAQLIHRKATAAAVAMQQGCAPKIPCAADAAGVSVSATSTLAKVATLNPKGAGNWQGALQEGGSWYVAHSTLGGVQIIHRLNAAGVEVDQMSAVGFAHATSFALIGDKVLLTDSRNRVRTFLYRPAGTIHSGQATPTKWKGSVSKDPNGSRVVIRNGNRYEVYDLQTGARVGKLIRTPRGARQGFSLSGGTVYVLTGATNRPARVDSYSVATGKLTGSKDVTSLGADEAGGHREPEGMFGAWLGVKLRTGDKRRLVVYKIGGAPSTAVNTSTGLSGAREAADAAAKAGFPADQIPMAVSVANRESSFRNTLGPTVRGNTMHGFWQISGIHKELLAGGDWRDPYDNAQMAYQVWDAADGKTGNGRGSWKPWSTRKAAAREVGKFAAVANSTAPPPADPGLPGPDCTEAGQTLTVAQTSGAVTVKASGNHGKTFAIPIPAGKRGEVIRFALKQVGKTYVFGSHGPNTWDCSGLAQAAWRAAGVSTPGQSDAQNRGMKHVPLSEALPGDLFWHPGHIQIYAGKINGVRVVIEAANPRAGVRVDDSGWMKPKAVLRPAGQDGVAA